MKTKEVILKKGMTLGLLSGSIAAAHRWDVSAIDSGILKKSYKVRAPTEVGSLSGAEWIRSEWRTTHRLTDFKSSGKVDAQKNPTEVGSLSGAEWIRSEWRTTHRLTDFKSSGKVDAQKNPTEVGSLSGAEWIRTTDSRIFSPMLYQLSYSTKIWVGKSRYFFEKAKFKLKFVAGIF